MQIDTTTTVDISEKKKQNSSSFVSKINAYLTHPGSGILALITMLAAILTFAILAFLVGYILVKGIPYLTADLFAMEYNSENVSLVPSLINTFIMTAVSL